MNRAFFLKKEERNPSWRVIDASSKPLGRMATEVAVALSGKDKPEYTPHTDSGDYVVIINCKSLVLTGNKLNDKIYPFFSGWRSGLKEVKAKDLLKKDPTLLVRYAVKRMLPKNRLGRQMLKKLKLYAGSDHPHKAQITA